MMDTTRPEDFFPGKKPLPHQIEFLAHFFAGGSPRRHRLLSAPGTGKGTTALAALAYGIASGKARRALALMPASAMDQWVERLRRLVPKVPVLAIDRRRVREMEDSAGQSAEIWPQPVVAVMSLDIAPREDVMAALARTNWDLLLVDDDLAHPKDSHGSQTVRFLADLERRAGNIRVLALQGLFRGRVEAPASWQERVDWDNTTIWTRDLLKGSGSSRPYPDLQVVDCRYCRHSGEIEILEGLQRILSNISGGEGLAGNRFDPNRLLLAASSSLYALEQELCRIRHRRNAFAHARHWPDDERDETGTALSLESRFVITLARQIDEIQLINRLDRLENDSKLDALVAHLKSTEAGSGKGWRTCVLTEFADTALYLETALREEFGRVVRINGGLAGQEIGQGLMDSGSAGILVVDSRIRGAMPEVDEAVFYDKPPDADLMEKLVGRFLWVGRRSPIRFVEFSDETNALKIERTMPGVAGSIDFDPGLKNGENLQGGAIGG